MSRQLWWGHRIPAYRVVATPTSAHTGADAVAAAAESAEPLWVVAESEERARELVPSLYPGIVALQMTT